MPFQAYLFHIYGAFLLNPVILPFRRMLISVGWLAGWLPAFVAGIEKIIRIYWIDEMFENDAQS